MQGNGTMQLFSKDLLKAGLFCVGTRGYGVPGNENDESIVCMSVLY